MDTQEGVFVADCGWQEEQGSDKKRERVVELAHQVIGRSRLISGDGSLFVREVLEKARLTLPPLSPRPLLDLFEAGTLTKHPKPGDLVFAAGLEESDVMSPSMGCKLGYVGLWVDEGQVVSCTNRHGAVVREPLEDFCGELAYLCGFVAQPLQTKPVERQLEARLA